MTFERTRDAHNLYRRFGFAPLTHPESHMEIVRVDPYRQPAGGGAPPGEPETS